jgi:AmiR/NasT family two-component response regulator
MKRSRSYVLVFENQSDDLHILQSLLERMCCPFMVTDSTSHMLQAVSEAPPCLVILAGEHQHWSTTVVNQLRSITGIGASTIVALTDIHAPSWPRQEDNPGLDGFLVKPLDREVLASLVQSARVRQTCCSV